MDDAKVEKVMAAYQCMICSADLVDYEPQMCCGGKDCGCYGMPVNAPICSEKCWDALTDRGMN